MSIFTISSLVIPIQGQYCGFSGSQGLQRLASIFTEVHFPVYAHLSSQNTQLSSLCTSGQHEPIILRGNSKMLLSKTAAQARWERLKDSFLFHLQNSLLGTIL